MEELLAEIKASVFMEYHRAVEKYGASNHSDHESFAIILEEFEEAKEQGEAFEACLSNLWQSIKSNMSKDKIDTRLNELQGFATHAAAEWVQVAAMCYKAKQREAIAD